MYPTVRRLDDFEVRVSRGHGLCCVSFSDLTDSEIDYELNGYADFEIANMAFGLRQTAMEIVHDNCIHVTHLTDIMCLEYPDNRLKLELATLSRVEKIDFLKYMVKLIRRIGDEYNLVNRVD